MSESNGSVVSRAELKAHLDPMRSDITEIKGDVKALLLANAVDRAASTRRRRFSDRTLAYVGIFVAALAPLAWLHPY